MAGIAFALFMGLVGGVPPAIRAAPVEVSSPAFSLNMQVAFVLGLFSSTLVQSNFSFGRSEGHLSRKQFGRKLKMMAALSLSNDSQNSTEFKRALGSYPAGRCYRRGGLGRTKPAQRVRRKAKIGRTIEQREPAPLVGPNKAGGLRLQAKGNPKRKSRSRDSGKVIFSMERLRNEK
jgi:hypothetical protein